MRPAGQRRQQLWDGAPSLALAPPEEAARSYEAELRRCFNLAPEALPAFNLILLGLGDNVHVASLFPHHPALHIADRLVVAVEVEAPQPRRVSLTIPVINNAARVMFIVSGENKAAAVKDALRGPRDPDRFPAQLVAPAHGEVVWLLDRAAARLLG